MKVEDIVQKPLVRSNSQPEILNNIEQIWQTHCLKNKPILVKARRLLPRDREKSFNSIKLNAETSQSSFLQHKVTSALAASFSSLADQKVFKTPDRFSEYSAMQENLNRQPNLQLLTDRRQVYDHAAIKTITTPRVYVEPKTDPLFQQKRDFARHSGCRIYERQLMDLSVFDTRETLDGNAGTIDSLGGTRHPQETLDIFKVAHLSI